MSHPAASPSGSRAARAWQAVRPWLAGPAKAALRAADRLRHPLRRRAARARLAGRAPITSVLVLCYGNICRSPYAAAVLDRALRRLGIGCRVSQGGFFGPGRPANERAADVAAARGVGLSGHSSHLVTADEVQAADLVVVMERWHAGKVVTEFGAPQARVLLLGDLDPDGITTRAIPDPYGLPVPVFERTYDRIDRCISELARLIAAGQPSP